MSWRSHTRGQSAWRAAIAPLRQEASEKGLVSRTSLHAALEALRGAEADAQEHELAEDLPFLVQQLVGTPPSVTTASADHGLGRFPDTAAHVALCRLLSSAASSRALHLPPPAANLVLAALRQWSDASHDDPITPSSPQQRPTDSASIITASTDPPSTAAAGSGQGSGQAPGAGTGAEGGAARGLSLEALAALAVLLPECLGALSGAERAAQLAALHSLLVPLPAKGRPPEAQLEAQCLALQALAACCGRQQPPGAGGGGAANAAAANAASLTPDEVAALLASAAALLAAVACTRSRPLVEDAAHSRMYAALLRALQAAVAEAPASGGGGGGGARGVASRQAAWVPRGATIVEGLQRMLTYGAHTSAAASAAASASASAATTAATPAADAAAGAGGGRRYMPPHLRRRDPAADGAGGAASDSDVSDCEYGTSAGGGGNGGGHISTGGGAVVVDRFRSSRVRLGALAVVSSMAKSDPRAMQPHWAALLPLQAPLAARPLAPHLVTVLLYDPLVKVRASAATTIAVLVDGPPQRAIFAVAEAPRGASLAALFGTSAASSSDRSASSRAGAAGPARGFLTLSQQLGQMLLGAHAGLLRAVQAEHSTLVLPGVLRALCVLMAASPYERLPPELLPETLQVLRARWSALAASTAAPASSPDLAPTHTAYLACLAEAFATKQPVAGLAAYLHRPHPPPPPSPPAPSVMAPTAVASARPPPPGFAPPPGVAGAASAGAIGASAGPGVGTVAGAGSEAGAGGGDGGGTAALVRELLALAGAGGEAAVVRIEALGALRGLAVNYPFALPAGVWGELRATAAVGLAAQPAPAPPQSPRGGGGGGARPPSRASSSSSLAIAPVSGTRTAAGGGSVAGGGGAGTPEDKAAQLSVKLVTDYLASTARQYGVDRPDGDPNDLDGGGAAAPAAAALAAALSPVSGAASEAEREAGVAALAGMWGQAAELLMPAATEHPSVMVRAAALAGLGEVPPPVFASLTSALQHRVLSLLAAAAAADDVAAPRAAACKALGAAAPFPAVLAAPELAAAVSAALMHGLRDSVLSVRIAAGWAVANLCDAYRRRIEEATHGADAAASPDRARARSHLSASTSTSAASAAASAALSGGGGGGAQVAALLPHHYRQLAALCAAAVSATQDSDKVKANGVRAVGNLLACLAPGMAAPLAAAAGVGGGSGGGGGDGGSSGLRPQGGWAQGRGGGGAGRGPSGAGFAGRGSGRGGAAAEPPASASSGGGGAFSLDAWLDSALACLQTCLTTGSMKVQWNACYAALGLLRNGPLRAYPRVASRLPPLLLLLVMLVRESANYKIRIHAAAALAALPYRDPYGDVLPDALLVVAAALESLSGAGGAATTAPLPPASAAPKAGAGDGDGDGEGAGEGEGKFPNYRYAAALVGQLRATLLHLLALAEPADARRVRDALARRADFVYACLRDALAEATLPLRTVDAAAAAAAAGVSGGGGEPGGVWADAWPTAAAAAEAGALPADPFGLAVAAATAAGRGASPRDGSVGGGLAALLEGLRLGNPSEPASPALASPRSHPGPASPTGSKSRAAGGAGGASRPALTVQVQASSPSALAAEGSGGFGGGFGAAEAEEQRRRAGARVAALAAPLQGFARMLAQLGPGCEAMLRDVDRAAEGAARAEPRA